MSRFHSLAQPQSLNAPDPGKHDHSVQFYDSDEFLVSRAVSFLRVGVREREPVVLIATRDHCTLFSEELSASGIDVGAARRDGSLTILDAHETLAAFMVDGMPDWPRFKAVVGGRIEQALASSALRVRAFGEMVDVLWRDDNPKAAIRLEELWNDLSNTYCFSLLCAYRMGNFFKETDGANFRNVCRAHTHVEPTEAYSQHGDDDLRLREVSVLQQRARALETEIAHRKQLEEAMRNALREVRTSEEERLKLLERERVARGEAETANKAKDEFLALLGHELRNPLSPIVNALQLMRLRGDSTATRERAVIERQVKHLVRLVDDLLDVSRITRGKIELHRERIEIADVIAKASETSGPLLEQRAHHLVVDVARGRGLRVDADPGRLAQVFSNLLSNAAKYTEPGGRITVAATRTGGTISVRVTDNGMGIDARLLPRIFEMFSQAEQALDRAQGGLGLGLAIVRSLVELHAGKVSARSEGPGRGTEFTVELPAFIPDKAAPAAHSATASRGGD